MEEQREHDEGEATSVQGPTGRPPDDDKAYDPSMTEGDEANVPPESEADPSSE